MVLKVPKENIPPGSKYKGTRSFVVQEIETKVHTIEYKYEVWQTPNGETIRGEVPNDGSHFGPGVKLHAVYQMAKNGVSQSKVRQEFNDKDLQISAGQIDKEYRTLANKLKAEKEDLLHVGLRNSKSVSVDDTGARHQGKNGYSTVIQNNLFTWFRSTNSKSRINFFEMFRADRTDYIINSNALEYLDTHLKNKKVRKLINSYVGTHFEDKDSLESFFDKQQIEGKLTKRILTESMLYAVLIDSGIPKTLQILSDGARQFDTFIHAMCWIHAERPLKKLLHKNDDEKKLIEEIRSHVWIFYSQLKEYQQNPTASKKNLILLEFERIFGKKTASTQLNKALKGIHSRMTELLRVLENPDIPLNNNASERDIREMVRKRKILGGTRSDEGREARDTYASLVKTCMKLGISFHAYLEDRITGCGKIPYLPDIVKQRAALHSGP